MKTKDIARQNQVSVTDLNEFLQNSGKYALTNSLLGGLQVNDEDVDTILVEFTTYDRRRKAEQIAAHQAAVEAEERKQQRIREEALRKQKALAEMLITSGFNFDGYKVVKYSGYISGDDAVQVDRGKEGVFARATDVGAALMNNLTVIRRNALAELKEQAYDLGCNAIIGVDFDYLTLDPETVNSNGGTLYMPYVFGVTANGNAVIIEKE